jgi:hypothetical protein
VIFAYLDIAVAMDISWAHDEGNAILVAGLQGCAGLPALSACKYRRLISCNNFGAAMSDLVEVLTRDMIDCVFSKRCW